ncbi:MAG: DUF6320 domain-containing protein [Senegalia sp. (in: firmicutes)]|uniref:DUF6320 domain-containing protein n=1 Tax=Senegalia sp. (in: firmicutes) TaxID=1924098 RepID=UPI003F9929BB
MKYCKHCKVYIRGKHDRCILCENILEKEVKIENEDIYPEIPPFYESHLAIKIMIFITIVALVVSVGINIIFKSDINWLILFMLGVVSIWVGLIIIVQKRYHIPKKILWQVIVISIFAIFWDYATGWIGWSLDYVIPIACVSAMIIMYVTAKIMKLSVRDYITYVLLDGIFGIIPVVFIIFDLVNILYPSIISIGFSIISISAIFIFQGKEIKSEMNKRMHI